MFCDDSSSNLKPSQLWFIYLFILHLKHLAGARYVIFILFYHDVVFDIHCRLGLHNVMLCNVI